MDTRRQTTIDAAYLALVSDFFLGAHIKTRGGTSLDNTFRLINAHQTEWILVVTQLSSFTRGAAQGTQLTYLKMARCSRPQAKPGFCRGKIKKRPLQRSGRLIVIC